VALVALQIGLSILTIVPFLGLIMIPLHFLVALGALALWIVLLLKANQGQMYKLPVKSATWRKSRLDSFLRAVKNRAAAQESQQSP